MLPSAFSATTVARIRATGITVFSDKVISDPDHSWRELGAHEPHIRFRGDAATHPAFEAAGGACRSRLPSQGGEEPSSEPAGGECHAEGSGACARHTAFRTHAKRRGAERTGR